MQRSDPVNASACPVSHGGCYELAGPGTTRDTHDDLPVGRKGVNNLGTSRLGFHLSGNIEHLRTDHASIS